MRAKIQAVTRKLPKKLERSMMIEWGIELVEVKERTPVKTGALRDSEHLEGPHWKWNKVTVEIVAGNDSIDYAWPVHEDLSMFHPHGQAKYIESVLFESAPFMASRIAKRVHLTEADLFGS